MMYDTLEVPLPEGTSFSDRIAVVKSAVEWSKDGGVGEIPFRSNFYYKQVVDLRSVPGMEIDAVLHLNAKKTGTHKIQIVEAGHKCQGQLADTLAQIVNEHPDLLAVSRVDSCADVVDGPQVKWIAQSVRARCAQWQAEFGQAELRDQNGFKVPWSEMGKREIQTMYIGKRPNCFRVYDKLAERRAVWNRERHRHERLASEIVRDKCLEGPEANVDKPHYSEAKEYMKKLAKRLVNSGKAYMPFPAFETWFAAQCVGPLTNLVQMRLPGQEEPEQLDLLPQLPNVITRVERQMAAGRVPDAINSFEKLFSKAALDFNPFDRLNFSGFDGATQIVMKHKGKCDEYCAGVQHFSMVDLAAGMQFKQWLKDGMSYQQLYGLWSQTHNGKRLAKKFAPFVAAANPPKVVSITASELYERYRESVSRQMAA